MEKGGNRMNYKIVSYPNKFDVLETSTSHIIGTYSLYKEAKDLLRHLNLGGGFDGNTPNFFMKKVKISAKKSMSRNK